MTTDNATDKRADSVRPLPCPADCTCKGSVYAAPSHQASATRMRGMAGTARVARAFESARDAMAPDEYADAVARALALVTG